MCVHVCVCVCKQDDLHQPLGALDMFVLIMFFLDILMTFRTAYVGE